MLAQIFITKILNLFVSVAQQPEYLTWFRVQTSIEIGSYDNDGEKIVSSRIADF